MNPGLRAVLAHQDIGSCLGRVTSLGIELEVMTFMIRPKPVHPGTKGDDSASAPERRLGKGMDLGDI